MQFIGMQKLNANILNNNLYGWVMLQKLPVNKFEWIKETS